MAFVKSMLALAFILTIAGCAGVKGLVLCIIGLPIIIVCVYFGIGTDDTYTPYQRDCDRYNADMIADAVYDSAEKIEESIEKSKKNHRGARRTRVIRDSYGNEMKETVELIGGAYEE